MNLQKQQSKTNLSFAEPPGYIIPDFAPQYKPPFGGVVDSSWLVGDVQTL